MTASHDDVRTLVNAGYSIIPIKKEGKSPALPLWRSYMKEKIDVDDIEKKFNGSGKIAMVCGAVSGGLELIDIDDVGLFDEFMGRIDDGLKSKLILEKSPRGYHIIYRHSGEIVGSKQLAMSWDVVDEPGKHKWNERTDLEAVSWGEKWIISGCRIETKGEGGYFLCAPSDGYEIIEGDFGSIDTLSSDERDQLWTLARDFDQRPAVDPDKVEEYTESPPHIFMPGDYFNRDGDIEDVLIEKGWEKVRKGTKSTLWRRPGKDEGVSGELFDDGYFRCYSTSVGELDTERNYDKFGLLTALVFNKDFGAAAQFVNDLDLDFKMTSDEVESVLKENPDEIDNAFAHSGLTEDEVCEIILGLGMSLPPGRKVGRVTVKYRKTELNRVVKEVEKGVIGGGGGNYLGYMGNVGYMEGVMFVPYNVESLELRVEESVEILTQNKNKWYPDRCPMHVVKKLMSFKDSQRERINAFSKWPLVDRDGEIYGVNGRSEVVKGVCFTHKGGFEVGEGTFRECWDRVESLICTDILFNYDCRELMTAAYIGCLIGLVLRPGFAGGAPGYIFTANKAGTGKSTAIDILTSIVTGGPVMSTTWKKTGEEREKQLISDLSAGQPLMVYDNIQEGIEIKDGNFAQAISSGALRGRILGKTQVIECDCRVGMIFGGNQLTVSAELARRCQVIQLMTPVERPEQRKFKDPDIVRTARLKRKEILGLVYRMIELGAAMDKAYEKGSGMGSFWDSMVRNPILVEKGIDIADAFGTALAGASDEMSEVDSAIQSICDYCASEGLNSFVTRDLFNRINSADEITGTLETEVRDALTVINGRAWQSVKSLGRALKLISNVPGQGGVMIRRGRDRKNMLSFCVVQGEKVGEKVGDN